MFVTPLLEVSRVYFPILASVIINMGTSSHICKWGVPPLWRRDCVLRKQRGKKKHMIGILFNLKHGWMRLISCLPHNIYRPLCSRHHTNLFHIYSFYPHNTPIIPKLLSTFFWDKTNGSSEWFVYLRSENRNHSQILSVSCVSFAVAFLQLTEKFGFLEPQMMGNILCVHRLHMASVPYPHMW